MLAAAATKSYQICVVQILIAIGNPEGKVKERETPHWSLGDFSQLVVL